MDAPAPDQGSYSARKIKSAHIHIHEIITESKSSRKSFHFGLFRI